MFQKNKEILLYWNRQIKEFINEIEQDTRSVGSETLFDEINYWKKSLKNIKDLIKQVKSPEIQRIIATLKMFNSSNMSSYLQTVDKLEVFFPEFQIIYI